MISARSYSWSCRSGRFSSGSRPGLMGARAIPAAALRRYRYVLALPPCIRHGFGRRHPSSRPSGPLEWLGTISYSIYLWHLVFISHPFGPLEDIVGGLQLFDRRFGAVLFVAAIPTLVVSWLSYVIVERAGLALRGWVRRPALDPTPTKSAVHRIFGWWGAQSFRARLALMLRRINPASDLRSCRQARPNALRK